MSQYFYFASFHVLIYFSYLASFWMARDFSNAPLYEVRRNTVFTKSYLLFVVGL